MKFKDKEIKLIALDLDGTLFQPTGRMSEEDKAALKEASDKGTYVVISTGRPYVGLPLVEMEEIGAHYAITSNGAAIYKVPEKELIYEQTMKMDDVAPLFEELEGINVYFDIFINGDAYGFGQKLDVLKRIPMDESLKNYIMTTREYPGVLSEYIREHKLDVQKCTIDFELNEDGTFKDGDKAKAMLEKYPMITVVSGGRFNFEFMSAEASKGKGLIELAKHLCISVEETMAFGDSENDKDILKTAGVGVAMENAEECLFEVADYVTLKNTENGVAHVVRQMLV